MRVDPRFAAARDRMVAAIVGRLDVQLARVGMVLVAADGAGRLVAVALVQTDGTRQRAHLRGSPELVVEFAGQPDVCREASCKRPPRAGDTVCQWHRDYQARYRAARRAARRGVLA